MKVFTNTEFAGHWPVGTSAAVVAETREDAAKMLDQALKVAQLFQPPINPATMVELDTSKPQVVILQNGDY